MIRSIVRSAAVLLGAVALVGGLAGQVPAAAADETQARSYETYNRGYDDRCPDHHEREFRGGTTCDYNGHGRYGYCSYGDDGYYAYDHGHRRHGYRHGYRGCRGYYDDDYYYGRYHYGHRGDHDGDNGHRGDGDGDNGRGDRGGDGDGDGGGDGGDD